MDRKKLMLLDGGWNKGMEMESESAEVRQAIKLYERTDEEKAYMDSCETFDPEMTYEEYVVHIYRCLLLSTWNYKPETAMKLIRSEAWYIREAYENKESVMSGMVEVGFGCG